MPSEINLSLSGNKTGFSEKIKASTMNQICPPAAKEEEFLLEDVEQKTKAKSIKKLPIRAPRILSASVPREYFARAMAQLQQPRRRPAKRSRASHGHEPAAPDPDTVAPKPLPGTLKAKRLDGRLEAGAKVLSRCRRIHQRSVMRFAPDDVPSDTYRPTDVTAMLAAISGCVQHEDWRRAVEIISVATHRKQSFDSRLALIRLAFVTLLHDPMLRDQNLLEGFVQGVCDCHNDAEIEHFLQMCSQTPDTVQRGELSESQAQRVKEDKKRLLKLRDRASKKASKVEEDDDDDKVKDMVEEDEETVDTQSDGSMDEPEVVEKGIDKVASPKKRGPAILDTTTDEDAKDKVDDEDAGSSQNKRSMVESEADVEENVLEKFIDKNVSSKKRRLQ